MHSVKFLLESMFCLSVYAIHYKHYGLIGTVPYFADYLLYGRSDTRSSFETGKSRNGISVWEKEEERS